MEPAGIDNGIRRRRRRAAARLVAAVAALTALASLLVSDASFAQAPSSPAKALLKLSAQTAAKAKKKPKKNTTTCTKTVVVKKNGKVVRKHGKVVTKRVKTTCAKPKPKLCVVQTKVNGKLVTKYRYVKVYKTVNRNGKKVKVPVFVHVRDKKGRLVYRTVRRNGKKVRVPKRVAKVKKLAVLGRCTSTGVGSGGGGAALGTPITLNLQPGSVATLDFYQFQVKAPLTGSVHGFVPGGYVPGQANQLNITGGKLNISPVAVVIDDVCGGQVSAAIQTSPTTYATVDPTKTSTSTISAAGSIIGNLNLLLNLSILLRHGDNGCNAPYLPTGFTTLAIPVRVFGKLDGLTTTLDSPEEILDNLAVCVWPGNPQQPCSGFSIPLPIGFSSHIVGGVSIG